MYRVEARKAWGCGISLPGSTHYTACGLKVAKEGKKGEEDASSDSL